MNIMELDTQNIGESPTVVEAHVALESLDTPDTIEAVTFMEKDMEAEPVATDVLTVEADIEPSVMNIEVEDPTDTSSNDFTSTESDSDSLEGSQLAVNALNANESVEALLERLELEEKQRARLALDGDALPSLDSVVLTTTANADNSFFEEELSHGEFLEYASKVGQEAEKRNRENLKAVEGFVEKEDAIAAATRAQKFASSRTSMILCFIVAAVAMTALLLIGGVQ